MSESEGLLQGCSSQQMGSSELSEVRATWSGTALLPNLSASQVPAGGPQGNESAPVLIARPDQQLACIDSPGADADSEVAEEHESRLPRTRLEPDQLASESDIVWLASFDDLDYVREKMEITSRRSGRPAYHANGRLLGYANLQPGTPSSRFSGLFDRRIFWLLPHDRGEPTSAGLYSVHAPLEAVDPRTIRPRQPGRLTDRAWGGPLPSLRHTAVAPSLRPPTPGVSP